VRTPKAAMVWLVNLGRTCLLRKGNRRTNNNNGRVRKRNAGAQRKKNILPETRKKEKGGSPLYRGRHTGFAKEAVWLADKRKVSVPQRFEGGEKKGKISESEKAPWQRGWSTMLRSQKKAHDSGSLFLGGRKGSKNKVPGQTSERKKRPQSGRGTHEKEKGRKKDDIVGGTQKRKRLQTDHWRGKVATERKDRKRKKRGK